MKVTYVPIGLTWRELHLMSVSPSQANAIEQRLEAVLNGWAKTKYKSGESSKGHWADCIGYVFGVVDELYRRPGLRIDRLPPDTSLHDPDSARAALRVLRRIYQPATEVTNGIVEPGDVVVTQSPRGGPGHIMLVGPRRNTLWHCNLGIGVAMTGFSLPAEFAIVNSVYRFDDREKWI